MKVNANNNSNFRPIDVIQMDRVLKMTEPEIVELERAIERVRDYRIARNLIGREVIVRAKSERGFVVDVYPLFDHNICEYVVKTADDVDEYLLQELFFLPIEEEEIKAEDDE